MNFPRARSSLALAATLACLGCQPSERADSMLDGGAGARDAGGFDAARADAATVDANVDGGPPTAIFVEPSAAMESGSFFDLPWPSDARVDEDGTLELTGFPGPSRGLVRTYVDAIDAEQVGFSTNGSVYFRFTHDVDATTLPASAAASLETTASVLLVAVARADGGAVAADDVRVPVVTRFVSGATEYWPAHTLALRPLDGFALLPATTYAAVVTTGVRATTGVSFERDAFFEELVAGDGDPALATEYAAAFTRLELLGVPREDVVSMAVFTTQDPIAALVAARETVLASDPPAVLDDAWTVRSRTSSYVAVEGRYGPCPTFQAGTIPYSSDGGEFVLDDAGRAVVQGTYEARFALSIPTSPMPDDGYPIALYGHGTGGDYTSFLDDRTASLLAAQGYAVIGIDAPLHGERNPSGASPDLLFFNIANPEAIRWNPVQAAVDHVVESRLVRTLVVPAGLTGDASVAVRFDPSRLVYVGHSQGALVGPLFYGVDDSAGAALFSAGGTLIGHTLLEKTEPVDIPSLLRTLLVLPGATVEEAFANEVFTLEHPIITLMQGWADPADPGNYAPLAFRRPREGFAPRSVIATEGLRDVYVAPASIEALAVSFGVPIAAPVARSIEGLAVRGLADEPGDVFANLAGGAVTGALLQFPDAGHFAFFDDATGRRRIASYFGSYLTAPPGTLPAAP